jgi:hypothetical protein
LRSILITEFCNTVDTRGIYRKYSAFIIGGTIIPRHVCFSKKWMLKTPDLMENEMMEEERDYIFRNPHEKELKEIFTLARIDYGRVDYGLLDGRLQIWEINTNPQIISPLKRNIEYPSFRVAGRQHISQRIRAAFESVDHRRGNGRRLRNPLRRRLVRERQHRCIEGVLKLVGLSHHEAVVSAKLGAYSLALQRQLKRLARIVARRGNTAHVSQVGGGGSASSE